MDNPDVLCLDCCGSASCPPGALYPDQTSGGLKLDDAVAPGGRHTYRWVVTPDYAPLDGDANCLTWVYHSHVDAPRDIYSGLIGVILTCKTGRIIQDKKFNELDTVIWYFKTVIE